MDPFLAPALPAHTQDRHQEGGSHARPPLRQNDCHAKGFLQEGSSELRNATGSQENLPSVL